MRRTGPHRLAQGGALDARVPIEFHFNGRIYQGLAGDTLSSALLSNGVRTVARSFKFHRPRGVFSCGVEEPHALLQLGVGPDTIPCTRAPVIELTQGLTARSIAGWPSLQFDLGRVLDLVAPLWAAGFYNKTFLWPSWRTYEGSIRRMAGLGEVPLAADPDRYETVNRCCDVLVIGGGASGLKAALDAGRAGVRVVLAEQDVELGARSAWDCLATDASPLTRGTTEVIRALRALPNVEVLTRTTATGFYDHRVLTLVQRAAQGSVSAFRERLLVIRANRVVLATGLIEQPLVFSNNDRPGIMLAGAARQYLRRYGVAVGSNVVIATNNDSAYELAQDLHAAGICVSGVADTRAEVPALLVASLRKNRIPHFTATIPTDTRGFAALRQVTLGRLSPDGRRIASCQRIRCDALAVSGGFSPALQLYAQAGGILQFDEGSGSLLPVGSLPGVEIIGRAATAVPIGPRLSPAGDPTRQWVDLLHDVTVADLALALREGYTAVEHVKRYTTAGMAADQGKTSTVLTLEALGRLRGRSPRALGYTTLRPPVSPVTLGAIAGRDRGALFAPHRLLPMHDWHVAHGALLQDFGEWRRPVVYLRSGETREQAVRREMLAVRNKVGLLDGSSLGKIEVHGPDALDFLDRFYINDLRTLKPHRARYGLMLRESGVLFDDGTVVMRSPERFLLTTTSGNAARVGQWLEEWHQCEWPKLRVAILPVTECWATLSLAGPLARQVLGKLSSDIPLAREAFPHLAMREGTLLGVPARIYRVSFSGELTYEINVPAEEGLRLWGALMAAGAEERIEPFGLDALMLLRLEKGFLHLGTDTDGTTIPEDVGWGKVAAAKKADFIGKRSLRLPEQLRSDRLQLVGLEGQADEHFVVGGHLRLSDSMQPTDGWITSAGVGIATEKPIALALLRGGRTRVGESVDLYDGGVRLGEAGVVKPLFYDPTGERMNV